MEIIKIMKPSEIKEIHLKYVLGRRTKRQMFDNSWELTKPLDVTLSNGDVITIPKGFKTDLSSIPEFMWGKLKPFGDFLLAPIVHDWMYRTQYLVDEIGYYEARKFADSEMYYISEQTNKENWYNRLDNWIRHKGVRLFGFLSYRNVKS